jgi:Histidine kinase-, DNA gyrase B-, and HSP90-like ATPase
MYGYGMNGVIMSDANTVQPDFFFEDRFLESLVGSIISDPSTAIVELVANCWDAYATEVKITWPDKRNNRPFSISDNGKGMLRDEFNYIWRAFSYNRVAKHGNQTMPPSDLQGLPRNVFGKNGKGRFASFCFAQEYEITSIKEGQRIVFRVRRTADKPLQIEPIEFVASGVEGHGTTIQGAGEIANIRMTEESARELIGSRFLANPAFKVLLNAREIGFSDISADALNVITIDIPELGQVRINHIDTMKADKHTKQHGIAWWVNKRAVGNCGWRGSDIQTILDGRTEKAKRFTFIVEADFLNDANAVKEDWSGFNEDNPAWQVVRPIVQDRIREIIRQTSSAEREATRASIIDKVGNTVNALSPISKERVETFVNEVVDTCPNIGEGEIIQLTGILAKLEKSKSRYGLLERLHECNPDDYDSLHEIMSQWTVGIAKLVLDEIQSRLKTINELRIKLQTVRVDEVHELQPIFAKGGLWMFGPEFETLDFTSNKGMTKVIRELFKDEDGIGSRNRPDFVIRPNASIGIYGRDAFNDEGDVNGVAHVIFVDLKTTGLSLGSGEKEQIWKYVKELKVKGYITNATKVDGFILGDQIETGEASVRKEDDDRVKITPMIYEHLLARAEKRMLNLNSKIQDAPFIQSQHDQLNKFMEPLHVSQLSLPIKTAPVEKPVPM